jgi:transposase-like protein
MYSLDFRRRAVALVEEQGCCVAHVAKLLDIGRVTLHRWLKLPDLAAQPMGPKGPRKLCPEVLAQHVADHPDAYIHERATALGVSRYAVWYGLRRLGIKKNATVPGKKRRMS